MRCAEGGDVCRRIVDNSTKRGAASQQPRKARHLRVGAAALGGCASAVCHRCSAPRAARPPWRLIPPSCFPYRATSSTDRTMTSTAKLRMTGLADSGHLVGDPPAVKSW